MKSICIMLALALPAAAEFRAWKSADGRTAELELVKATEKDGEKAGEFRMRNGSTTTIKASGLAEEDAKVLADFKPAAEPGKAARGSVFDEILNGNLMKLEGEEIKAYVPENKPEKYYIFYYTASWCGPCHAYTPQLAKFYNENKNSSFELVVVSLDRKEPAMNGYIKKKKMPWPALKFSETKNFMGKFNHEVQFIPMVVTCKIDGTVVSRSNDLKELSKLVK
jgi:thiol-disulfide isomerase/thioredoxin